jgi:hypothetical protein
VPRWIFETLIETWIRAGGRNPSKTLKASSFARSLSFPLLAREFVRERVVEAACGKGGATRGNDGGNQEPCAQG